MSQWKYITSVNYVVGDIIQIQNPEENSPKRMAQSKAQTQQTNR